MKKTLCMILLIATLLSAFSITALADDNAQSGSGDTQGMATGYAWYNTYQYLWKVTLFAGKSDQVSKQSNLKTDFYRLGTVIMKKTGWTVSSSVKFGNATKIDYYAGTSLSPGNSPTIISDVNCPAIPIVCNDSTSIETVKSYFGSTGTMTTILNAIADTKCTTKESILWSLPFTIGGQKKSNWSYEYVAPNGTSNRIPWVIVYEPMVILNLKDQVTKLAFTATEFALAEMYGWYDWGYSGGSGQNCLLLPRVHLPTSVQLEESWFGYPVYAVTSNNYRWNNEDIVKGGGWGMRWLPAAVKESTQQDEIDYGCYFGDVSTPQVGGYGTVEVYWMNYKPNSGTVFCELYHGSSLIWSGNKTLNGGAGIKTTFSVQYTNSGTQTLTCKINYSNRNKEVDPNDNMAVTSVTPTAAPSQPEIDYGVSFLSVEQPEANSYGNVVIKWKNWTNQNGTILCELYQDGTLIWSEYKNFTAYYEHEITYNVHYTGTNTTTLQARINYADRYSEKDASDNVAERKVTPTKTKDDTYDFSVSDMSVSPSTIYNGEGVTVSFVSDNWNTDLSYDNIAVDVLVGDRVVKKDYVDFLPYGNNTHRYTIYFSDDGTENITARINWQYRNEESNRYNNSVSTSVTVKPYYEFSVSNLALSSEECSAGENITVTCKTDSWDRENAYEDVPVQFLYNGEIIYTEYVDYDVYESKKHTFNVNVGNTVGVNDIKVRVNWPDHHNEVKTDNNETNTVQVTVMSKVDLSIEAIVPNSDYRAGMTVVTSYRIFNNSSTNIIPDHNNTVSFESYYYDGSTKVVISSQAWKQAVIPSYDNNLVYFKWTAPTSLSGKTVYCTAVVNAENGFDENDTTNNTATLTRTVTKVNTSQTTDTQYEANKPSSFIIPSAPSTSAGSATWSLWTYSNGSFVKKNYGVAISSTAPTITPDEDSPSAEYKSGQWQMKSGYGIYLSYSPGITSISGYTMPLVSDYTEVQRVEATFPEFNYAKANNSFRSLEKYGDAWVFVINSNTDGHERLHFTPLWYPNGNYIVSVTATDVWTPAGMISSEINSNTVKIVDSAYDDWYVGEG